MRRTFAGLMFALAYACASLTIAGFLLQRTAFDPDHSAEAADVVLGDSKLRTELSNLIADQVAASLGMNQADMRLRVQVIASTEPGAKLMSEIIHDAHAHLIGEQKTPVQVTGSQLVDATQIAAAIDVPTITIPIPKVTPIEVANSVVGWLVPVAAITTVIFILFGITAHPDRSSLVKSLGVGLLLLAVMTALFGYVLPKFAVPAMSDSVWARIPAALADDTLPLLVGLELVLVGTGVALLAGTGVLTRRRSWSAPVKVQRYSEDRHWS